MSPANPPTTGREFYKWLCGQPPAVKLRAAAIARSWGHPCRYLDWTADQVSAMYDELIRKGADRPGWGSGG